jgi:hypothetical protein
MWRRVFYKRGLVLLPFTSCFHTFSDCKTSLFCFCLLFYLRPPNLSLNNSFLDPRGTWDKQPRFHEGRFPLEGCVRKERFPVCVLENSTNSQTCVHSVKCRLKAATLNKKRQPFLGDAAVNMFPRQEINTQQQMNCWKQCFLRGSCLCIRLYSKIVSGRISPSWPCES